MKSIRFSHCLAGVVVAAGLLSISGVQGSTLLYVAAVLACPLMMILMMRGMMGGHGRADHSGPDDTQRRDAAERAERS